MPIPGIDAEWYRSSDAGAIRAVIKKRMNDALIGMRNDLLKGNDSGACLAAGAHVALEAMLSDLQPPKELADG